MGAKETDIDQRPAPAPGITLHRPILMAAVCLAGLIFSLGATASLALATAEGVTAVQSGSSAAKIHKGKSSPKKVRKG